MLFGTIRLSDATKLSIALCLVSALIAFYAAELYFMYAQERRVTGAAEAQGKTYDSRTMLEVIDKLRRDGIDAFPTMRAKSMLKKGADGTLVPILTADGKGLLPFASISEKTVVSCNESGQRLVYKSDQHGFNNPPAMWEAVPLELAIVGDSFAHGSCVSPDRNTAAWLAKDFGSVVNLGVSGFGPLMQLASIKEYLEPIRPRVVLWFYYEGNDLTEDLAFERRSPLMMKYLTEDDFRQGLLIRRKEVSERLEAHFRKDLVAALKGMDDTYRQLQRFLQLFHVRGLLGLAQNSLGIIAGDYERDTALFEKILDKARASIDTWGGRFVFVYLPESGRYFAAARDNAIRDRLRGRVLEILAERDIPLVDVHEAFAASPDPRQMYQYPGSHFNDDGYKLTADLIANYLRAHPGRGDG